MASKLLYPHSRLHLSSEDSKRGMERTSPADIADGYQRPLFSFSKIPIEAVRPLQLKTTFSPSYKDVIWMRRDSFQVLSSCHGESFGPAVFRLRNLKPTGSLDS